jgi:DNA replication regulator DPB11
MSLPQPSTLEGRAPSLPGASIEESASAPNAEDEEELAAVKRVPAVTLQLWESLLRPRGFELVQGALVRSPSKSQVQPSQTQQHPESPTRPRLKADTKGKGRAAESAGGASASVLGLSTFKRAASFAVAGPSKLPKEFQRAASSKPSNLSGARPGSSFLSMGAPDDLTIDGQPGMSVGANRHQVEGVRPGSSFLSVDAPSNLTVEYAAATGGSASPSERKEGDGGRVSATSLSGMFSGMRFRCLGEAHCETVRSAIESNSGQMLSVDDDTNADYILVRLVRCELFSATNAALSAFDLSVA